MVTSRRSSPSARPAMPATRYAASSKKPTPLDTGPSSLGPIVVLPNSQVPQHFALPECPRWQVIDRDDLPTLAERLREVLLGQEIDRPLLTSTGIEQLQIALSGRGLPQRDVVARALENEDAADILTERKPSS